MKKLYNIAYIILIILLFVVLILYINIENNDVKNIMGNIFAGLITGLVIALLSNLKNKYLNENTKKIKNYQELLDESQTIIVTQINLQAKSQITIVELIYLYSDIYNNINSYHEIDEKNIKEGFNKIKHKWEDIDKNINETIGSLSEMMYEDSISIDRYKTDYQRELGGFITDIHMLKMHLKRDLDIIINDTERLSKSII